MAQKIQRFLTLVVLCSMLPAMAQDAPREIFPSDYKPSPCAPTPEAACQSAPKGRIVGIALAFRGYELHNEWVDKNWDEMMATLRPVCTKLANCFTVLANDWVYCTDLARDELMGTCTRFPEGSYDRDQCTMFTAAYYIGLGKKEAVQNQAQDCVRAQGPAEERTLVAWISPAKFAIDHDGEAVVHAYDAETRIPVRARMKVEGPSKIRRNDGPELSTGYPTKWTLRLPRVPNAEGHSDVFVPKITIVAPGYKPLVMNVPVEIPRMTVEMTPSPDKLKAGKNTITVTAKDAATGKPIWARVMAGDEVLGDTNKPLELHLERRGKHPEIWVTSFYDHYSDVVVAKAK